MEDVQVVALTQGAGREFPPIPLGADGSTTHGVVYDHFRLLSRAAYAAAAAGAKLDPENPPREVGQHGLIILAYALTCDGRTVRPTTIDVVAPNGAAMPRSAQHQLGADELARALPGVQLPGDTLAVTVGLRAPRANDTIRITYSEAACGSTSNAVNLPLKGSAARAVEMPMPPLPSGASANARVLLQALVDLDGAVQRPAYVGGPAELLQAAIEAAGRWRFEPARINGAPLPSAVLLQVAFTASQDSIRR